MLFICKICSICNKTNCNNFLYIQIQAGDVNSNQEHLNLDTIKEQDINKSTNNKENKENRLLKRISPENRLSLKPKIISQKGNSDEVQKPLTENIDSSSGSSDSSLCLQPEHKFNR